MLWSLNRVLKATVSGCPRLSRLTDIRALWHQLEPTSTKAAAKQFIRSAHAAPATHKHFHRVPGAPRKGRMNTDMAVGLSSMKGAGDVIHEGAGDVKGRLAVFDVRLPVGGSDGRIARWVKAGVPQFVGI
jgi:hypothetical protein